MKPALEHLPREGNESFVVKSFDYAYFPTPWHYHPEYEIVLVTESTGQRMIGDRITSFGPGNLALIGPNIPHTYRNDERYYADDDRLRARSIVVHFTEASLGKDFLQLPESGVLRDLLDRSRRGLEMSGQTNVDVSLLLEKLVNSVGIDRWIMLTTILSRIAVSNEAAFITSAAQTDFNERESNRLCSVFEWMTNNFDRSLRLAEAADIAGMNQQAFSRFFALRTRKTFSEFTRELRLQKAAQLLAGSEMPVTALCFECGYNNVSNFNRQFLQHYGMSPLRYRKAFLKN